MFIPVIFVQLYSCFLAYVYYYYYYYYPSVTQRCWVKIHKHADYFVGWASGNLFSESATYFCVICQRFVRACAVGVTSVPVLRCLPAFRGSWLTLRPLMSSIVDVPHRKPPKLHFIYLFIKYRYRIF